MYICMEVFVIKFFISRNEFVYLKVIVSVFKYLYFYSMDGLKFVIYWYLYVSYMLVRDVDIY